MNNTENNMKLHLSGWVDREGRVGLVRGRIVAAPDADKGALLALFPKSCGMRAYSMPTVDFTAVQYVFIEMVAKLIPNDTTGEKNEAGVRRILRAIKAANKHGVEVVFERHPLQGRVLNEANEQQIKQALNV